MIWWALWACTGAPDPVEDTAVVCDTVGVRLGTGASSFEPLTEGAELTIVRGPQGGNHLLLAGKACGLPDPKSWAFTVTDPLLDQVVSAVSYEAFSFPTGPCCVAATNMYGYLTVHSEDTGLLMPDEVLDGHELRVELTLTDVEGGLYTTTTTVIGRSEVRP